MSKVRALLACGECGHAVTQWVGRCPGCGAWGSIGGSPPARTAVPLFVVGDGDARIRSGFEGVDRVLGGGLIQGSVVLVAGEPGIGKSTLLLQLVANLASLGRACVYASGEESRGQVADRARRLGIAPDATSFVPGRELPAVLEAGRAIPGGVLVVDSIQSIRDPAQSSLPGGPSQVRGCADALIGLAKAEGVTVVLAGQVTKDGDIAGPRTLEHAVDVVCSFDGDPRTGLRLLAGGKNRFGPEGEVAWFEMSPRGLSEVDPSHLLGASAGEVGAATALVAAGRRSVALEVQALAMRTEGPPRRQVTGLDPRRFGMIAAVVERSAGIRLSRSDLYGSVAGGLRVDDPGADLAVAAALASAATGTPPPAGSAFVGEVALTGAIRQATGGGARLAAAAPAGVRDVWLAGDIHPPAGIRVRQALTVRDALGWATPR